MSSQPIIYIVDDDDAVRDGLSLLLESEDLNVKTFSDCHEFLDFIPHIAEISCLILDVRMPKMNGPELQAELVKRKLKIPIIFLTAHGNIPLAVKSIQSGAIGFLTKPVKTKELLDKVREALALSTRKHKENCMYRDSCERLKNLTKREHEVLTLALKGYSNKEIAKELNISFRTVEHHRSHIFLKTGVDNLLKLSHLVQVCY